MHLDKLTLGLPCYIAQWVTEKETPGAKVSKYIDHPPYENIREFYIDSLQTPDRFDSISASYNLIVNDSDNAYRQLYF